MIKLFAGFKVYAIIAGVVLLALAGAYGYGYISADNDNEIDKLKADNKALNNKDKADEKVFNSDDFERCLINTGGMRDECRELHGVGPTETDPSREPSFGAGGP